MNGIINNWKLDKQREKFFNRLTFLAVAIPLIYFLGHLVVSLIT